MGSLQKQNCHRKTDKEKPPDPHQPYLAANRMTVLHCFYLLHQNEPCVKLLGSSTAVCHV